MDAGIDIVLLGDVTYDLDLNRAVAYALAMVLLLGRPKVCVLAADRRLNYVVPFCPPCDIFLDDFLDKYVEQHDSIANSMEQTDSSAEQQGDDHSEGVPGKRAAVGCAPQQAVVDMRNQAHGLGLSAVDDPHRTRARSKHWDDGVGAGCRVQRRDGWWARAEECPPPAPIHPCDPPRFAAVSMALPPRNIRQPQCGRASGRVGNVELWSLRLPLHAR
mmetsp:Transcript_61557/g.164818  ORF Transcript_61557/g.164818 Transcript_61557/m.164818 type:complete len:217 (+) Transcript_61557:2-652(+)